MSPTGALTDTTVLRVHGREVTLKDAERTGQIAVKRDVGGLPVAYVLLSGDPRADAVVVEQMMSSTPGKSNAIPVGSLTVVAPAPHG